MDIIDQSRKVQEEISFNFQHLPMAKRLLVQLLMLKADPETGVVATVSYDDLSSFIQVQKTTIKRYMNTLALWYPKDIEIMSGKNGVSVRFIKMAKTTSEYFNPDPQEYSASPIAEAKFFINNGIEKTFKPITSDYYPSQETIERGKKKSFEHITNQKEIDAFIDYHQKNDITWEDYDDIYLIWLYYGEHYWTKVA